MVAKSLLNDLAKSCHIETAGGDEILQQYSTDESIFRVMPDLVVFPADAAEVSAVIEFCARRGVPVVSRGGGSGIAGQSIGEGVIIDFRKYMNSIINFDKESSTVRVQPGVILKELNDYLGPYGCFFPPDPSSMNMCSLGGMVSTNAGGIHTVKYGSTKDYINRIEAVLSDGRPATFTRLARDDAMKDGLLSKVCSAVGKYAHLFDKYRPDVIKNSSGYNVFEFDPAFSVCGETGRKGGAGGGVFPQKLICGSEGTLVTVVEAELKVRKVPGHRVLIALHFSDLAAACSNAREILRLEPSALELIDDTALDCVQKVFPEKISPGARSVLLCEFAEDSEDVINSKLDDFSSIATEAVAEQVETGARIDRLWELRRAVSKSLEAYSRELKPLRFIEDSCVHPTKVEEYIMSVKQIVRSRGLNCAIFGHAGDGNIHVNVFLDPSRKEHRDKIEGIYLETLALVKKLRGSLSGEHGDGLLRAGAIREIFGDLYPLFEEIKRIFDPRNILNPGKIISNATFAALLARLKW